jgi:tetratricopeptide (TPR) repeat protein
MSSQRLNQAYELIKAKKKQEAVDILLPILKFDDNNADAWWLMANALEAPGEIREALENVLRLRPENDKARKMLDNLNLRYPPPQKTKNDDEFSFDDDDPFAVIDAPDDYQPKVYKKGVGAVPLDEAGRVVVTKPKGKTSPWVIILAIIGGVVALGCVVCLGLSTAGISIFNQAINDPTLQAVLQEMPEMIETVSAINDASQTLPDDLQMRGTIEPGQTVRGTVDTFDDDGWTFSGSQGRQTTIELTGSGDLDPQLYIYDADRRLIGENDDIELMKNTNSRIELSLPYSGDYTIVVSAFGSGGDYELIVR